MRRFGAAAVPVPDEVFALETTYPGGGPGGTVEVAVTGDRAEVRYYEQGRDDRYYARELAADELDDLRRFVTERRVDDLRSLEFGAFDGVEYHYVHVTPNRARRVVMNNPPGLEEFDPNVPEEENARGDGGGVHADLVRLFNRLNDADRMQVRYNSATPPAALEVLYAHPENAVWAVWARGEDVRVLVPADEGEGSGWFALAGGKLGAEVPAPDAAAVPAGSYSPYLFDFDEANRRLRFQDRVTRMWQVRWGGGFLRGATTTGGEEGTWLCNRGQRPEKVLDEMFRYHVVTADGKWVVGTVGEELKCYDLTTRRPMPLADAEALRGYFALRDVPTKQRVLLVRHATDPWGLDEAMIKFRLLDPATGQSEEIRIDFGGEHDVLLQQTHRPFQPTTREHMVWAAVPEKHDEGGGTYVGRLDTQTLNYVNLFAVPSLTFDSDGMWVDESTRRLYAIHGGHLFRMPLPEEALED